MKRHWNRKPIRRALRRPFEWLGILLGLAVLPNLPRRAMFALCDLLGAVMYAFDRKGKALARENLRIVMGRELAPRRERLIIRRSYRNMARTVGHVFWTARNAAARARASAWFSEKCKDVLSRYRPLVTVSAHLGCWEVLSQLVHLEDRKMMSVAKDIGTPAMTALLMRSRKSIGQDIVHADGAFRHLYEGMKAGSDVGLLVDQVVKPRDGGLWVRFFGRPVPVSAAPAFLAAKTRSPTIVAWSRPLKDGRYRCEFINFYPAEGRVDLWGRTQSCMRDLERTIRRHPSCWVLNYRYFRKVPDDRELAQLEARESKATAAREEDYR